MPQPESKDEQKSGKESQVTQADTLNGKIEVKENELPHSRNHQVSVGLPKSDPGKQDEHLHDQHKAPMLQGGSRFSDYEAIDVEPTVNH